jgi:hypothetical protein
MIVNCVVNAVGGVLPSFYIFKGERIKEDYIQQCKLGSYMAMQKKKMDDMLFVQTNFLFFYLISTKRLSLNKICTF